jgi:hypothetical protein
MSKFPFETNLLTVVVDKVYSYHDVPRLFTAKQVTPADKAGNLWLVLWADEHDLGGEDEGGLGGDNLRGQDDWLAVPISDERLSLVEAGKIDLHDAFRKAEGGEGVYVECPWPKGADKAKRVVLADLDPDLFHTPGVSLGKSDNG